LKIYDFKIGVVPFIINFSTNVRLSVRPFHISRSNLRTPWPIHYKFHRVIGIDGLTVCILYGEISNFHSRVMGLYSSNCTDFKAIFRMSRCKLRTPWPIHFKLRIVIGIDSRMVCILFGEISVFDSRVIGLYSSNCRRFFVCRAVNWEPLGQFTSNFAQLLELIVLRSLYFLVKFRFFIQELWERKSLQILYECWRQTYHVLVAQLFIILVFTFILHITVLIDVWGLDRFIQYSRLRRV
jgi:hypothetical protein